MKISILLPFKNAAPWIEATIDSILNQTHANWELIAIDDHSGDDTRSKIGNFRDSRIHVIQNTESGIIPALQIGLQKATGDFITRMDADDLMPEYKLETLLKYMQSGRTVVTGKVKYFAEGEVSKGYQKYENWLNARINSNDHFNHIYRECVIASPNWLVAAEFLKKDEIFKQLKYPEDYDMTFLWRKYGYNVISVNEITHFWREHPARTSRNSEIYDQESFFNLKLNWFAKSEKGKTLGVFGAGAKGKLAVSILKDHFEITWFDHEYEKMNAPIQGYTINNPADCRTDLLLIAVYPENLESLEHLIASLDYKIGENAWYV